MRSLERLLAMPPRMPCSGMGTRLAKCMYDSGMLTQCTLLRPAYPCAVQAVPSGEWRRSRVWAVCCEALRLDCMYLCYLCCTALCIAVPHLACACRCCHAPAR